MTRPFCMACEGLLAIRGNRAYHASGKLGHTPVPVVLYLVGLIRQAGMRAVLAAVVARFCP